MSEDVQGLVQRWRDEAARKDSFHATMGIGWKVCAKELEAALDSLKADRDAHVREAFMAGWAEGSNAECGAWNNAGPGPTADEAFAAYLVIRQPKEPA